MLTFNKIASINDWMVKSGRLCIPLRIVHAAAAAIVYSSDLPDAVMFAGEGQAANIAAIVAIEAAANTNFTAPVAANGIVGIFIYNLGTVRKLLSAVVYDSAGVVTAVIPNGLANSGVTAGGNIALSLDSATDLVAVDLLTATLCIDYIVDKS